MATYTIETPRGRRVTVEADSPDAAIQGAQRWDLEDYATSEAQKAGLNPELVLKQMKVESAGNPKARSPKGAIGPMQLMPGTAKELGVDPNDPYQNITGGVTYLRKQLDAFNGDEAKALAAYNAGPGAVRRAGGVPKIAETQDYVSKIATGQPFAAPPPAASPIAPAKDNRPVSETLGFYQGFMDPINNAAQMLEGGARKIGVPVDAMENAWAKVPIIGKGGTAEQAAAEREQRIAASPNRPGKVGVFAGNVAATAPIPGGPMVNGALSGVALSHEKTGRGLLGDALYGAAGGKIGSSVVGGAGKVLKGVTGDALTLARKGVPLTIGQAAGGVTKGIEDRLTSLPGVGDVIRNAQRRSLEGFDRAAYNDALSHVGEELPKDIGVGGDAYNYTKDRLSDLYDEVLKPLTVNRDVTFSSAMSAAKAAAGKLGDPAARAKVGQIIKTEVQARFDKAGQMTGEAMKGAQEALGQHINDLSRGTKWERDAATILKGVKGGLEGLVARTNPAAGEQLARINRAYANFKPLEDAVSKAKDGVFTPAQLAMGAKKGRGVAAAASGRAPQASLARAGRNVLPSSVPESGTAGRLLTGILATGLGGHFTPAAPITTPVTLGLLGGMAAYSKEGQKLLTDLMTKRPEAARVAGKGIRRLAPVAGTIGAAATAAPATAKGRGKSPYLDPFFLATGLLAPPR